MCVCVCVCKGRSKSSKSQPEGVGESEVSNKCQLFSAYFLGLVFLGLILLTACSSRRSQSRMFAYGFSFLVKHRTFFEQFLSIYIYIYCYVYLYVSHSSSQQTHWETSSGRLLTGGLWSKKKMRPSLPTGVNRKTGVGYFETRQSKQRPAAWTVRDPRAWRVGNRNVTRITEKKHAASAVWKKRLDHERKNEQQKRESLIEYNLLSGLHPVFLLNIVFQISPIHISWTVLCVYIILLVECKRNILLKLPLCLILFCWSFWYIVSVQ